MTLLKLRPALFALCLVATACHRAATKPPAAARGGRTTFTAASITQIVDLHGRVEMFAVAADGAVWRFADRKNDGWLVESLGGKAASRPSVVSGPSALLDVFIVGTDGKLWRNGQAEGASRWLGWGVVETPPVEDVVAAGSVDGSVIAAVRTTNGELRVGRRAGGAAAFTDWQSVAAATRGHPIVMRTPGGGLEIAFVDRDGTLNLATRAAAEKTFRANPMTDIKVQGELIGSPTVDGRFVLVARDVASHLFAIERTAAGWGNAIATAEEPAMRLGAPSLFSLDGRSINVLARGSNGTIVVNRLTGGRWEGWRDTGMTTNDDSPVALNSKGRRLQASHKLLEGLVPKAGRPQRYGFELSVDKITPTPAVEDDVLTISYRLTNDTGEPGTGRVMATWDGAILDENAPAFSAPLAVGRSFQGSFSSGGARIGGGRHRLDVVYKAGTEKTIQLPDRGEVTLEDITQYAEWNGDIDVLAFSDRFPTDTAVVTPGPWSCVPSTPAQQHACGEGSCSAGGNTNETCPQDCPRPAVIQSYNDETRCSKVKIVQSPKSIDDLQAFIKSTKAAGGRLRVMGAQHTSNAQLCTDGQALAMDNLRGAAPLAVSRHPGAAACQRFDCSADLSAPAPALEAFDGIQTVRVGPGQNLFDLSAFLDDHGYSLGFAVPGFRAATVGGAVATGTHGSSPSHPAVLSTRVVWMLVVAADGTVEEHSEKTTPAALWHALRASIGYLGVVVQLRLAVEPAFNLHAIVDWHSAHDLLGKGAPQSLVAGCDFGELVWFPHRGDDDAPVMRICETKTTSSGNAEITILDPSDSDDASRADPVIDHLQRAACSSKSMCDIEELRANANRYYQPPFSDATCDTGLPKVAQDAPSDVLPALTQELEEGVGSTAAGIFLTAPPAFPLLIEYATSDCSVDKTGKGYRMMSSKLTRPRTRPFERDWEIFIPGDRAQDAIHLAKDYFRANQICLPLIGVFLRFAPAEAGTLIAHTVNEGAFARTQLPGMFFEMVVFMPKGMKCDDQARYEKLYADLAEQLVRLGGRAHWGKNRSSLFQLQRQIGTYGPNMEQYRALVKQRDPTGVFANQFGVDIGLRWPQLSSPIAPDTDALGCTP